MGAQVKRTTFDRAHMTVEYPGSTERSYPMARRDRNLVVALVLLAVLTLGCTAIDEARKNWFRTSVDDERDAAIAQADKQANDDVMKSESVQLEGKWTWPSLTTDYTESLQNPRIYPIERVGEGWTFTIIKKGDGYTTVSGGTVTLKGTSVTIFEESGGEGDSISLTGEVKGDTIVGTVHRSVVAKTLSSGVPQGAGEYDGPWTATRVK
jgi:hypothetical protein